MNKKILVALLIPYVFSLTSCASSGQSESTDAPVIEDVVEEQEIGDSEEANEASDMGYGSDTLAFEVDDMVIMDLLLLNFNSDGEIIQLMDFYTE